MRSKPIQSSNGPKLCWNAAGGEGPYIAIATISSHLNLNRDHRSNQIRANHRTRTRKSPHITFMTKDTLVTWVPQFGNGKHTTATVAALVFVRSSGKSPAFHKSTEWGGKQSSLKPPVVARGQSETLNPHESIAVAQDTPQQAPCKIDYVGYDPAARGRNKRAILRAIAVQLQQH